MAEKLSAERRAYLRGLKEGFSLGFGASAEGWNAEYPFGETRHPPEHDPHWVLARNKALKRAALQQEPRHDRD